jgi:chemotaxis protein CheD
MKKGEKFVKVAECAVTRGEGVLYTLGLGSCVAVLLYDPETRVGGMAHVLLPAPRGHGPDQPPAKFATTAVPHLLEEMEEAGARRDRITARLVGGASMFRALVSGSILQTGERNLTATREALEHARIPIVGEEVGKEHGRSVRFHVADGRVVVGSVLHGTVEL